MLVRSRQALKLLFRSLLVTLTFYYMGLRRQISDVSFQLFLDLFREQISRLATFLLAWGYRLATIDTSAPLRLMKEVSFRVQQSLVLILLVASVNVLQGVGERFTLLT